MPPSKGQDSKLQVIKAFRNDAFDSGLEQYFKDIRSNKISKVLNDSNRKVKLATVTYRQVNSWEEQGLLTIEREEREWRKFSIIEAVWLKIISELRDFGFPIEKIKVTKESLSYQAKKYGVQMPFLEFFTAFAIGNKMPVLVLVFKDGAAIPVNFTQYRVTKEVIGVENHIQINLNDMLQSFFPNVDLRPSYELQMPVSLEEMELLAFMRVKEFEKVEIRYQDGRMDTIEGLERMNAASRVNEILQEQNYSRIELIQEDGKVTSVTRRTRKRFKK